VTESDREAAIGVMLAYASLKLRASQIAADEHEPIRAAVFVYEARRLHEAVAHMRRHPDDSEILWPRPRRRRS
jgi:hypothetical protein